MIRLQVFLTTLLPVLHVAAQCAPGFMLNPRGGPEPCVRQECDLEYACFETDNKYFDRASGNRNACCGANQNLIILDEYTKEGICCDAGQNYVSDATGFGKCCLMGEVLENGVCIPRVRCRSDEVLENGFCIRRCRPDEFLENGVCVPLVRCRPGDILENGVCVPLVRCLPGEVLENGVCIPRVRCRPDEFLENGVCVPRIRCLPGEVLEDGVCIPRVRCRPDEVLENGVCIRPITQCGGCTPGNCKRRCTEAPVCGNDKCIGLKYGKCYFVTFPDGKQLVRERESPFTYKKDAGDAVLPAARQTATIGDIPFKVCKSTDDCGTHHGECIRPQDHFYLQDQTGTTRDPNGTPGFIDNTSAGFHQKFTTNPNEAAQYQGRTSCSNGECAIQLYGGPLNPGSLVPACPMPDPGLTFYENMKVALRMHFIEVPCDGDYPRFWRETGADRLCD